MINFHTMKDPNSLEAVVARRDQEDPIVMYLIVRESLKMGVGKIAAQCAHAASMLVLSYQSDSDRMSQLVDDSHGFGSEESDQEYNKLSIKSKIFSDWLSSSFRKIVLKADEKEWVKLKEIFKDDMELVIDAGLTEIPNGSETVIGIPPMFKSSAPKIIKKLQTLK